jgi:hypothetical protein
MPRFFTLAQVRDLLPRVKTLIEQAVDGKAQYEAAQEWTQDFAHRVTLRGGILVDRTAYVLNKDKQERGAERLKSAVEEIHSMGVLIKDLDIGLVDFPTLFRGEEVYLCWRMGEADVRFWHGVHEGFQGRKAIDQEFLNNHRGREAN